MGISTVCILLLISEAEHSAPHSRSNFHLVEWMTIIIDRCLKFIQICAQLLLSFFEDAIFVIFGGKNRKKEREKNSTHWALFEFHSNMCSIVVIFYRRCNICDILGWGKKEGRKEKQCPPDVLSEFSGWINDVQIDRNLKFTRVLHCCFVRHCFFFFL